MRKIVSVRICILALFLGLDRQPFFLKKMHMAGDGYVAAKAKRIGPQNNPMIRLGLEPKTPE